MTRRPARPTPQDGFTLLEVLVSLTLLALIAAALAQAIFGARAALGIIDRSTAQTPIMAAQSYLRAVVSQARMVSDPHLGPQAVFVGSATEMAFFSTYAPASAYQGVYRVSIRAVQTGAGKFDLLVDQQISRAAAKEGQARPGATAVLLRNAAAISFAYPAQDTTTEGPSDVWRGSGLPEFVSIDVRFPAGDPRSFSRMTISPELAAASKLNCPARVECD